MNNNYLKSNILEPVVPVDVERYDELIKAETTLDAMCLALNGLLAAETYAVRERVECLLAMFGRLTK